MAQKRNVEREIEKAVKIGEANAALIPRLQRWCDHLRVEQTSAGLLATMSSLPIGMMQVSCPHATKGIQAIQLHEVAAYFVTQNCRDCLHHKELHPENIGREILRKAEQVREEHAAVETTISDSKRRLRGLVSGDLTHALRSAPTTEQSVLELVVLLDDSGHADRAAASLLQAAEMAPEFFSEIACEVIAEHMFEISHGGTCAKVLRTIGQKRNTIPTVAIKAALYCATYEWCHDEALGLLGDHFGAGGKIPPVPVVVCIIGHHGYSGDSPLAQTPTYNPGQVHALVEIGKRDLDSLVQAFSIRLQHRDKTTRIAASVTFRGLMSVLPELGPPLTEFFAASLGLEDDYYHSSADVCACDALADIFAFAPSSTSKKA